MSTPLRAGIVGGGFMAEVHARAVRAAGHEVRGIVSSSAASTDRAAERLRVPIRFASPAKLIESDQVDVVHICTPNNLHLAQAGAVIEAAKAVVCEKPLATTAADARALHDAADRARIPTAVPFVYRYYPAIHEIRERIRAGDAGELLLIHGSYLQDWLAARTATNWRVSSQDGGPSRAFADIGVHWCDLMEFVTGHRITRVSARLITSYSRRGGSDRPVGNEDASLVMFETDRGAAGSLTLSQISQGRKNRLWFSFDGTEGSYEFNQEDPNSFWVGGLDRNSTIISGSTGMRGADSQRLSLLPAGHPQGYQDAFNAFMTDAYDAAQGASPSGLPTFADGYRAASLTDAVIQSSVTEQWVTVTSPDTAPSAAGFARIP